MYGMNSAAKEYDGTNKYIRITDISETSNKFVPNPITSPDGNLEDKYKLIEGDIVFARTGASTGKTYIYDKNDGNLYFAGFLIKFHINNAYPRFIFYNTQKEAYLNWVSVMSVRSGQPGINSNEYKKLPINLPSFDEQKKISDFLELIDNKIELLEKKHENYQNFKKYLMQQIFAQKLRFDNSSIIQKEIRLGDVISIINKRNKNNDKLPVLSISNKFGFISQTEQFEDREVASSDKKNYKIVNNGEFAYNPARINVGSIAQLKNYDKGIISPMYIVFKIDSNELDPIFFENFLDSDYFRHEMLKRLEGSVRMILSAESLKNIKLTIPSIEEQKKISEIFLSFDKKIDITKYQLDNMKEFKKGLLQQMFVYIVRPILLNFCAKICCIKYFLKLR